MPFRLINAGATFQRAMDIDFKGLINRTVVVYLDDITVFSKERSNHLHDLNQIFQRCKKYGISLNPKKSFFALDQGKLLGFIVSKEGIYIDPDRIKEIFEIPFPHNKESMQSFLGKINFVKRFIPDFSHIILPLQTMIKKNSIFKWGSPEKEAFELIKQSIINAPSLNTPNLSNHFTLYTITSDCSYAAVLTQINDHNLEAPISFYSSNLQGAELNYYEVEKQAFFVYKAVKHYRPFLLNAHKKVIVPFSSVRQLLIQRELGEKRANWEAQRVLQELHDGPARGHFGADTTAHKVIHAGYYWPTMFRDAHEYVRRCRNCQTSSGRQKKSAFPLQTVNIEQPFEQWGLDIIGEITPNSSKQHKYILTATDYFTKWVEAIPLKKTNSEAIIEFIDQFIITRITQKASIGSSPFKLVYGKEVVLPTNLILPSLALVQFIEEKPSSSLQLRHDQILKLEEEREKAKIIHAKHQQIIKSSFDSISSGSKQFQVGDLVLKWDKAHEHKGKHTKFQKMWLGPF
eukprot:PITA_17498